MSGQGRERPSYAWVAGRQSREPGKCLPSPEPQSIYSQLSPSWHSEPGSFFLQGLRGKNILPTADKQPLWREKSTHCSVKPCCLDFAGEMRNSRQPLPPWGPQEGLAASSHSQSQALPKCLAPCSTHQHQATEASGTLGCSSWMNMARSQGAPTLADSGGQIPSSGSLPTSRPVSLGYPAGSWGTTGCKSLPPAHLFPSLCVGSTRGPEAEQPSPTQLPLWPL